MRRVLRATKRVVAGACAAVLLLTSVPGNVYAMENDIPIESAVLAEASQEVTPDTFEGNLSEAVIDAEDLADIAETEDAEGQAETDETAQNDTDVSEEMCELEEEDTEVEGEEALYADVKLALAVSDGNKPVKDDLKVSDYQNISYDVSSGECTGVLFADSQGKYSLFLDYTVNDFIEGDTLSYQINGGDINHSTLSDTETEGMLQIDIPEDGKQLKVYIENNGNTVSYEFVLYLDLFRYNSANSNFKVESLGADEVLPNCKDAVYKVGTKASEIQKEVSFADGKASAKLYPVMFEGIGYYYLAGKLSSDIDGVNYVINGNHENNPDLDGDDNDTFLIECWPEWSEGLDVSVMYKGIEVDKYQYTIDYENAVKAIPATAVEIKMPAASYIKPNDVYWMSDYQKNVSLGTDDLLYGELSYRNGEYHLGLDIRSNADLTVKFNGKEVTKEDEVNGYDFYFFDITSSKDVITVSAQSDDTYGKVERKILLSKLKFEQLHQLVYIETENVNPYATYPVKAAISDSLEFASNGMARVFFERDENFVSYAAQVGDKYQISATAKPGTKIVSYRIDQINIYDANDVISGKEIAVKNNKLNVSSTVIKGYIPHVKVKIEDGLELKLYAEDDECAKLKDAYIVGKTDSEYIFTYSIEQYSNLREARLPINNEQEKADRIIVKDGKNEIPMDGNFSYSVGTNGLIENLKFTGDSFVPSKSYQVILQRYDNTTEKFYDSGSFKITIMSETASVVVKKGGKAVSTITMTAGSYAEYDYTLTPATATGADIDFNAYYADGTDIPKDKWDEDVVISGVGLRDGKIFFMTDLKRFRAYCEANKVDSVTYVIKPGRFTDSEYTEFIPLAKGKAFKLKVVAPKQIGAPTISSEGLVYNPMGKYEGYYAKISLPKSVNQDTTPCYYYIEYTWDMDDGSEPISDSMVVEPDEDTGKFDTEVWLDDILPLPAKYDGTQVPKLVVDLHQQVEGQDPREDTRFSSSHAEKEFKEYWATNAKDITIKQVAKTVYTGQGNVVIANVKYADKVTCKGIPDVSISLLGQEISLTQKGMVDYNPISGDVIITVIPDYYMIQNEELINALLGKQKLTIKAAMPNMAFSDVSKTITVNISKGIDSLDIQAGGIWASEMKENSNIALNVYKPAGKAVSLAFTAKYNSGSGIAPKTKKVTYEVRDLYGNKQVKGVTVKNGKLTIDKSHNVSEYGERLYIYAQAADFKGNPIYSERFQIVVSGQKTEYDELMLVKYDDGAYYRVKDSKLPVGEVVENDDLFFAVRPSNIPMKDKYTEGELIFARGNFTIKSSNKKVVVNSMGCGVFEPVMSTVKGVVFTATAADGSKKSVKSGKYDIVASEERVDFGCYYYADGGNSKRLEEANNTVILNGVAADYIEFEIYGINKEGDICEGYPMDLSVSIKNGCVWESDGVCCYAIRPTSCTKPVVVTITDNAAKPKTKKVITFKHKDDVKMTVKPAGSINMESYEENLRLKVTLPDGFEPEFYDGTNADTASLMKFTYMGKENENYNNFLYNIKDGEDYEKLSRGEAFLRQDENGYYAMLRLEPYSYQVKKGKYNMACYLVDYDGNGVDQSTAAMPVTFEVKQTKVGFNPSAKGTNFTMSFDGKAKWTKTSKTLDEVIFYECFDAVVNGKATKFSKLYTVDEDGAIILNSDYVNYLKTKCESYEDFVKEINLINENSVGYVEYAAVYGGAYKYGMMLVKIKVPIPSEAEYNELYKK